MKKDYKQLIEETDKFLASCLTFINLEHLVNIKNQTYEILDEMQKEDIAKVKVGSGYDLQGEDLPQKLKTYLRFQTLVNKELSKRMVNYVHSPIGKKERKEVENKTNNCVNFRY